MMDTEISNNELRYQIALTQIDSIGPSLAKYLLERFGSASAVFNASKKDLLDIEYFGNYILRYFRSIIANGNAMHIVFKFVAY